jgi:hypothetical protein
MDLPGRNDPVAAWEASQAYERTQKTAATRAHRAASADERRRERAASRAARAARHGTRPVKSSRVEAEPSAGEVARRMAAKRRALGWWTAFAMLLAWVGSLPLTYAMYREPDDSPMWTAHLIFGMPTVVSGFALVWFLSTVPAPGPTFRRILGAVLLAPLFLVIGVLVFLFTAGFGSWAFAWFLSWQGTPPSTPAGERA